MMTSLVESPQMLFAVYKHPMVTDSNTTFAAKFIVRKNQYGRIVDFTELELFTQPYTGKLSRKHDYTQEHYLVYISMALNYFFENCGIPDITAVSPEMVLGFLQLYAETPQKSGKARSIISISRCVSVVSNFFANLYLCTGCFDPDSLMQADYYKVNIKSERVLKKYAPVFQYKQESVLAEPIFRDIPIAAMDIILEQSRAWNKRIYGTSE